MDEAKERVYWTDLSRNVVESVKWSGDGHRIIKENVCKFFKYSIAALIIDMNSDNLITVQINTPFFFLQIHSDTGTHANWTSPEWRLGAVVGHAQASGNKVQQIRCRRLRAAHHGLCWHSFDCSASFKNGEFNDWR